MPFGLLLAINEIQDTNLKTANVINLTYVYIQHTI
jgi:hypothetical protein